MLEPAYPPSQSVFLDLLRYGLALVVVVGHGFGLFLGYFEGFFPNRFPHLQSIAVVCFFYLSGFLIVGSQLRHAAAGMGSLGQYLFDRATRVYVTLLPSLLFVWAADLLFAYIATGSAQPERPSLTLVAFLKNLALVPSEPFGTLRPIWSLMYEWWIYILFGGLFYLRSNWLLAGGLVLAGLYRVFQLCVDSDAGHIWFIWGLGGLMAYVHRRFWRSETTSPRQLILLASAFGLAGAGMYAATLNAYGLVAGVFLSFALFTWTMWSSGRSAAWLVPLSARLERFAGFSFTLFLTHYTVLAHTSMFLDGWVGLIVGVVLSHVVAFVIASVTEYRLSALKRWMVCRSHHWDPGKPRPLP
jgi:peptidoglycan/LPS O-acetylase OafA/YrhL